MVETVSISPISQHAAPSARLYTLADGAGASYLLASWMLPFPPKRKAFK